jgi:xanthine/CO dehydrogenase XdhC/CoxF family maturation factor
VLVQAAAWTSQGTGVVLATVVRTWGSAPRRPGGQMCIDETGYFVGSVSGGCVEGAVIHEAHEAGTAQRQQRSGPVDGLGETPNPWSSRSDRS